MFEGFTQASIKAFMIAQQETRRLNHSFVGSDTILLGLIDAGGLATLALKAAGIDSKRARSEVESIIGRGSYCPPIEIPHTPRAKKIIELSWAVARQLECNQNYISTKHLLLGLIDEALEVRQGNRQEGVAARVLENCAVDLPTLRRQTVSLNENLSVLDMPSGPQL